MAEEVQNQPVKDKVLARILALDEADKKKVIKTRARRNKIRSQYVGHTLAVFNGREYKNLHVTQEMVGRTLADMVPRYSPTAQSRYVSIPPRKMRQVADMVVGAPVEQALNVLNFTPKVAARHMAKTLKAAVANKLSLSGTSHLDPEDLYIEQIIVNAAPTAKRIRFQSMGRVFRIRKRYCHLAIYLDQRPQALEAARAESKSAKAGNEGGEKKPRARKTAAKKMAKKSTKKTATKKAAAKKSAAKKADADKQE